jgi:hypothetical protein
MFQRAFIEITGNRKYRLEELLVQQACEALGIEVVPYLAKQIQRRQLPLTRDSFICGDMDAMHGAMKQLGIEPPVPNDFPTSLARYFRRKVWRSSIRALEHALEEGREIFAKPAGRRKRFTGRVFTSPADRYYLSGTSAQEPLWCSEVVRWISEFRVYVIHGEVVSINPYQGDASESLCESTLRDAIEAFTGSGEAPAAYGIDFGVLDTGETALVEANDGYSLGAYGIDAESYTRLLFTRWEELLCS